MSLDRITSLDKIIEQDEVGQVDKVLESRTATAMDNSNYRSSIVRGGDESASRACCRCGALVQVADFTLHDDFHAGLLSDAMRTNTHIDLLRKENSGLANSLNLAHQLIDFIEPIARKRYNQMKNMNTVTEAILPDQFLKRR